VFGLLGVAIALRLLFLGALFLAHPADGSFSVLIPDEGHMAYRAEMLRLIALDVPLAPQDYIDSAHPYGWTGLHYAHAYLLLVLGDAPYAIRLPHLALYLAGCIALYRVVRPTFGTLPAFGGLATVLFLPSLFIWSMTYLKDAPYLYLTTISLAIAVAAARRRSIAIGVLATMVVVVLALMVRTVRPGGEIILGGGIVVGLLGAALLRRPRLLMVVSLGGMIAAGVGLQSASVQQRGAQLLAQAAQNHAGFVYTGGWTYKVLDAEFYQREDNGTPKAIDPNRFTAASTARYILRATASFFLMPLPWTAASPSVLAYLPEQLVWDLLVVLAVVGVVSGCRKDAIVTPVLAAVIVLGAVIIGMTSGNVGTLVRHRAMVAVLLPWFSSLGACEVLALVARLRGRIPHPMKGAIEHEEAHAAS
jgi:hypothetical protein